MNPESDTFGEFALNELNVIWDKQVYGNAVGEGQSK
jgi:hypothetical protein